MRVIDMIQCWARTAPHRPAIIQSEIVTTYQGLDDAIESIGERIDRLNLDKREPVAVCLANPSFMLATVFALMRGGYSVAPVNTAFYPHLAGAGLRNLIYDTAGQVTSGGRNIRFDMSWLPNPKHETANRTYGDRPVENVDCVFFTSGTTGLPKKIVQPAAALERLLQYPFTCASGNHQKILVMPGLGSTFGFQPSLRDFERWQDGVFCAGQRGRPVADRVVWRRSCRRVGRAGAYARRNERKNPGQRARLSEGDICRRRQS